MVRAFGLIPAFQRDDRIHISNFAALSREDRAATLVLDPTREGRQRLTDAIRLALLKDGTLGQDAVVATVLEPCGLSKAETGSATSYVPGSVVTFRQGNCDARLSRGRAYRVDAVDAEAGDVSLVSPQDKTVAWRLRDGAAIRPSPIPRSRPRSAPATGSSTPATTAPLPAITAIPPRSSRSTPTTAVSPSRSRTAAGRRSTWADSLTGTCGMAGCGHPQFPRRDVRSRHGAP